MEDNPTATIFKLMNQKAATIELKPCPFCGGKAIERNQNDLSGSIVCSKCGFVALTMFSWDRNEIGKEKAISAWNTRT